MSGSSPQEPSTARQQASFPAGPDIDDPGFKNPLDILVAEHQRQHAICDQLDRLAEGVDAALLAGRAAEIIEFLRSDLAWHTLDEERGLFPALRRRCRPEDGMDLVLERLMAEHSLDHDLVDFLLADLELLALGHRLANPTRFMMNVQAFTATQRRHLAWENATVIPLARRRLKPEDLRALRADMSARRRQEMPSPAGA